MKLPSLKCIKDYNIFKILSSLVFVNLKNISLLIQLGNVTKLNYDKDMLYDFFKNEWVDWGKILTNFSMQFLKITKLKVDSTNIYSPK
jgi:hypothetical protein